MGAYILRRLLLIIPTLIGIMLINFTLIQFVPGGPIELLTRDTAIPVRVKSPDDAFRDTLYALANHLLDLIGVHHAVPVCVE